MTPAALGRLASGAVGGALMLACVGAPARLTRLPSFPPAQYATPPLSLRVTPPRLARERPLLGDALICAGGDVMLGNALDTAWAVGVYGRAPGAPLPLPPPASLVPPLRDLVADAAVVMLNVEGAIGEGPVSPKCRRGSASCYQFRQPVAAAAALRAVAPQATVVGNVANNHAMDAGPEGFDATVRLLRAAGVTVTGADTLPALVPLPSGDTVAFLGFSTFAAGPDARDLALVRRLVARAAARYGYVVVSVHNGAEGKTAQRTRDVDERYLGEDRGNPVAFAHAAVEAGAAAVFGHGPHVLRSMEWHGEALVVYSLGNLLTHGPFLRDEPLNRGGLACVHLGRNGGVLAGEFRSIVQRPPGVLEADPGGRAGGIIDSLSALDFPATGARVVNGFILRH